MRRDLQVPELSAPERLGTNEPEAWGERSGMQAHELRVGDEFRADGTLIYTVENTVITRAGEVHVKVRYAADGGTGTRAFDYDQEVPLVRPAPRG